MADCSPSPRIVFSNVIPPWVIGRARRIVICTIAFLLGFLLNLPSPLRLCFSPISHPAMTAPSPTRDRLPATVAPAGVVRRVTCGPSPHSWRLA